MAKKLYEESNIQAIANAIREKNGETTTYKTSEMANAISAITTGEGGGGVEVEPIVLSGDCSHSCYGEICGTYLNLFGNKVFTSDISTAQSMFEKNTVEIIPFDINFKAGATVIMIGLFKDCINLKTPPRMNNVKPSQCTEMFSSCYCLRNFPEDYFDAWDFSNIQNGSGSIALFFENCYSLRSIPKNFMKEFWIKSNYYFYSHYNHLFQNCYTLNEVVGLMPQIGTITNDMLSSTFRNCYRLKRAVFALQEDNSPYVVQWNSQQLNFDYYVGYSPARTLERFTGYNSGITADKEVIDDATYQALKDDPDWFTQKVEYSRYNHDSAVETINSLPDASAYLATAGGTNIIKFKGASGSLTDGGAINTLTEEEIAVAAAKGWTVLFA